MNLASLLLYTVSMGRTAKVKNVFIAISLFCECLVSSFVSAQDPFSSSFRENHTSPPLRSLDEQIANATGQKIPCPSVFNVVATLANAEEGLIPHAPSLLSSNEFLLDANTNEAIRHGVSRGERQKQEVVSSQIFIPAFRSVGNRFRSGFQADPGTHPIPEVQGAKFKLAFPKDSREYQDLLAVLLEEKVGKEKGEADRSNIADAFFAITENGEPATYVTGDGGISKKMWAIKHKAELDKLDEKDRNRKWLTIVNEMPLAFEVEINGRRLKLIALPSSRRTLDLLFQDVDLPIGVKSEK